MQNFLPNVTSCLMYVVERKGVLIFLLLGKYYLTEKLWGIIMAELFFEMASKTHAKLSEYLIL